MRPVLDRPFLQHLVEQLVQRGVTRIDFVLPQDDGGAMTLLGDGSRWGIEISCRRVPGEPGYGDLALHCVEESAEPVWVGPADNLPFLPDAAVAGSEPALFFESEGAISRWTGWASMHQSQVARFCRAFSESNGWRDAARKSGLAFQKVLLDRPSLTAGTPKDLLMANRTVLEGRWPGLFFWGREREPGIWIARGAKIHRSAVLEAPCYIGENAWVGDGCRIGPCSVVAPNSVVERGTSLIRSVVASDTYLGPGLMVNDCMVEAGRVHNTRLNTELNIAEPHILSSLRRPTWGFWKNASGEGR